MTISIEKRSLFDASASAVGYAHQFRFSLLSALQLLRHGIDWQISIEAADDIEIQDADGYRNYLQLKHRAPGTTMTNASSDLWKSLRIWSKLATDGQLDLTKSRLLLITTGTLSAGGAAAALVEDPTKRDVASAMSQLNVTAGSSNNKANEPSYLAWNALGERKEGLLTAVTVVEGSDDIDATHLAIQSELLHAAGRANVDAFVSRLEGWWFQKCINILRTDSAEFIEGDELDAFISELRQSFLADSLPIDPDVTSLQAKLEQFATYRFTRQIQLVGIGQARIADAVRDYYRAVTQRSRWVREGLVRPDEIAAYEDRLVEEWRYVFNRLLDDLPEGATEELKTNTAKQVYKWVEEATAPPIRAQRPDLFLVRGSLHILADSESADPSVTDVGWHPDFAARLIAVLEPVEA
ncbi:hypothetical protein E3T28_12985 [Cryobacterium sinapicolor]|uniref:ABC-three component systems C-terminal domain-containing protein n=1 Tax=Cryobacterium sinapicolor TaxID=1259236 RepID=A0ABY2IXH9_9MICO|nr:ABC-three component system protein [Cryobacterium sinapicolor]TFC95896.1 hypothetical protein E3T28_12985 [Cryobacterium sinapicolor]